VSAPRQLRELPRAAGAALARPVLTLRAACLGLACLILSLLYGMARQAGQVQLGDWDKVAHAATYGMIAVLLTVALKPQRALFAAALTSLAGLIDELHQVTVPGRSADLKDWLADTIAAVAAVLLLRWFAARQS